MDGHQNYESVVHGLFNRWAKHKDDQPNDLQAINEVMYAAAIIPGAFKKGYKCKICVPEQIASSTRSPGKEDDNPPPGSIGMDEPFHNEHIPDQQLKAPPGIPPPTQIPNHASTRPSGIVIPLRSRSPHSMAQPPTPFLQPLSPESRSLYQSLSGFLRQDFNGPLTPPYIAPYAPMSRDPPHIETKSSHHLLRTPPCTGPLTPNDYQMDLDQPQIQRPQPFPYFTSPPPVPFITGKSTLCEDLCEQCDHLCPPTCLQHCGPQTHIRPLLDKEKPSKIIVLLLSQLEVIPPQYLCQDARCPCTESHQVGMYSYRLDQDGGTLSLPPREVQDAMEMVEERYGNWREARRYVEGFNVVHEACDFGFMVSRYDDWGEGTGVEEDWIMEYFRRHELDYVGKP
ncbi:MAG: hypothetical protein LQ343_005718 [Gyalolechia ehrenbergii]|nr:MAG: hypothetical protein LQ343_005718 [Gyalolechia ehrenbergii]